MTNRSTVPRRVQPRIKERGPDPCPPLEGDRTGDFSGADPYLRGEEIDPDPGCGLGNRDQRGGVVKADLRLGRGLV